MGRHAVIVGGGVIGSTTALFLARKGWDVTLIDRGTIGNEASRAAAGILSPPFFLDPDDPDEEQNTQPLLSRKGFDFYPDFLDLLNEYSDRDVGYRQTGTWYLAFTEEELDEKKTMHHEMGKFNRPSEWAQGDVLKDRMPYLSSSVKGGLYFAEEAQVDPDRLMRSVEEALRAEDVDVFENTPVQELDLGSGGPEALTPNDAVEGDVLLLAAGAWSRELGKDLDTEIPVEPRKGQMLSVEAPELKGEPPVRRGERFVLPRGGGAILGSTTEEAGFNTETTAGALRDLLESGIDLIPHLAEASFVESWAGLRPYAAEKGGAFLGRVPNREDVFMACGHYKTGILQGPFTGKVMADAINGDEPDVVLSRYGLNR